LTAISKDAANITPVLHDPEERDCLIPNGASARTLTPERFLFKNSRNEAVRIQDSDAMRSQEKEKTLRRRIGHGDTESGPLKNENEGLREKG